MATSHGTLPALLDELQAAEEAGAEALGLWIAGCDDARLRGGLRVIRARDLAHARLARRRLSVLGGTSARTTPRQVQNLCGVLAAPDVSNRSKLAILLSRFPDRPDDRLPEVVRGLDDAETRALLETVHDDDRVSLRWLREMGETIDDTGAIESGSASPATLLFLDALRAAEAASAEVFAAWRIACTLAGLRGGLETIAEREATHAAVVAERLTELGGVARAHVDEVVLASARDRFGSPALSDDDKLALVAVRYADEAAVATPIEAAIESLADDAETREMLRLLAAGESATFAWLRAYHRAVAERPREVSLRVLR